MSPIRRKFQKCMRYKPYTFSRPMVLLKPDKLITFFQEIVPTFQPTKTNLIESMHDHMKPYIRSKMLNSDLKYVCLTLIELIEYILFFNKMKKYDMSDSEMYEFLKEKSDQTYRFADYINPEEYYVENITHMHMIAYCDYIGDLCGVFIKDIEYEYDMYSHYISFLRTFNEIVNNQYKYLIKFFVQIENEKQTDEFINLFDDIKI